MRRLIILILCFTFTSCGFYHYPKVYRKNGIPYDVAIPLRKNMKKNKYGPNNPYYEKDTTEIKLDY